MRTHTLAVFAFATLLPAQWSNNPAQNLAVGDRTGEQVLPKIAATSDGGCYLGWFDHAGSNYDVYLQRLDAAGQEQWPHGGILVSGNPQSTSLVDWDLLCDRFDHCVLVFTDTRAGSDLDVYAYRIAPNGSFDWGSNGVTLSANADYEPSPRCCETSNGDFVFVWMNGGTGTLQVQRLDRAGNVLYPGNGLVIPGDTGAQPGFCRVVAGDAGSFVVSWVRTIAFTGQKHVHAQKYDLAGTPLWNGGTRLPVFDQASVPIAHEPRLLGDGQGGALVAWHFAQGQQFFIRVQHIAANGSELFPHNGVDVSSSGNSRFDPAVCWRASSQETFVFWNERNLAQSSWGILAQKLDAQGLPAWGSTGVTLLPIDTVVKYAPEAVPFADGAIGCVLEESLGGLNDKVRALRLDGAGNVLWQPPVDACTRASDKLRLRAAITTSGVTLLAWGDNRADAGNVIAQNVNPDGSLGARLGTVTAYGCGFNPAGSLLASGRPAIGTAMTVSVHNPLGTQGAGSLPLLVLGFAADPLFPCGTLQPAWAMAGPGHDGEVLLDLAGGVATLVGAPWTGQPVPFTISVPLQPALAGALVFTQGVMLDLAPGASVQVGLTTAARLSLGY
ncbi:MAG TPA: hypothetical protein VK348_04665 [Planctomycetota bacterium]|nr:hypothetical protein [Planctomycetota bacterium]